MISSKCPARTDQRASGGIAVDSKAAGEGARGGEGVKKKSDYHPNSADFFWMVSF
jgi:hypothetical protein